MPLHRFATPALCLVVTLAFAAASASATGADTPAGAALPPVLSPADQALVQKATDYLQNLKAVEGRFTQIDPKAHASTGTFYLQRPGKARFEYDPPAGLLMVADGFNVSVYDSRLKSFEQYPLGQTPLVLLLAKTVRLDHGVVVTGVDESTDGFTINARDARKEAQGRISIQFARSPLALRGWTVVDAQGQATDVKLGALTPKPALKASLFVLRDPRPRPGRP